MRKGVATQIVARRLGVEPGRAAGLVQSASDGGVLPKARGRDIPDLGVEDLVNLLLVIACDRGLGVAAQSVREFSALTDGTTSLHGALVDLFSHGPALAGAVHGDLVIRLDPATASLTAGGHFRRFGPEPPPGAAGRHVIVPGRALAAIGLELQGRSPAEADELVALARITASHSVGLAFSTTG
ncbi:MAG: hypothetical protein ABS75_18480 [Pelagibacterium sp. SCN 63-23]|nr:MAG: hypothetical protein ABS75_18480 [Pelagibacterium sp. SCN 63-23]